jgi:hypothetical protein
MLENFDFPLGPTVSHTPSSKGKETYSLHIGFPNSRLLAKMLQGHVTSAV